MKILSAGIIIFNEYGQVLLGHPTNNKWNRWNIPKGHVEEGESPIEAAIRETKEETDLWYRKDELKEIGRREYIKTKDLHLFTIHHDVINNPAPYLSNIKCHSMVNGEFPEFDRFIWLHLDQLNKYVSKNLKNLILEAKKKWD